MKIFALAFSLLAFLQTPPMHELAPTGTPPVAIGVGAANSAFWASRDPATGCPRGVTVDLGPSYALSESAFLVLADSPIVHIDQVNRAGTRVAGYVTTIVEEVKASGLVRRALDNAGLPDGVVAPPGR
jgi:polar amino acid transport system substrate-binding protein